MTTGFSLRKSFDAYFDRHPIERTGLDCLESAISLGSQVFDRNCLPHHWTASAWILETSCRETLVIFHRKLQRWIQPGGHADGDENLPRVALREAREETGLGSLRIDSEEIFDFGVTPIPAHNNFPAHTHLDVRFLVWADRDEPIVESAESAGARWVPLSELDTFCGDQGISRMAAKSGPAEFWRRS